MTAVTQQQMPPPVIGRPETRGGVGVGLAGAPPAPHSCRRPVTQGVMVVAPSSGLGNGILVSVGIRRMSPR